MLSKYFAQCLTIPFVRINCFNYQCVVARSLTGKSPKSIASNMSEKNYAKFDLISGGGVFKSSRDKKNYKLVTFENGFRALLISDCKSQSSDNQQLSSSSSESSSNSDSDEDENDADMKHSQSDGGDDNSDDEGKKLASASLTVKVGNFSDPKSAEGLAHLVEHTIFMGNKDYPEENSFDIFINKCNGYFNAYTNVERTRYEFQVPNKYLREALKRFSAIFVEPLFNEDSIAREIRPVDNEFKNSLCCDEWRIDGLLRSLGKKDHPISNFTWGNSLSLVDIPKSLGVNVRDEVMKFWKKHYFASNMNLVIQGEYDLSTLEAWVGEFFSRIPAAQEGQVNTSKGLCNNTVDFPFRDDFYKLYYLDPAEGGDHLRITWWLPPRFNCYKSKPLGYISKLIGHEGKGSLFSYLKRRGLATELVAGNDESSESTNEFASMFLITIRLTDKGLANLDKITNCVFAYMDMIKKKGVDLDIIEADQNIENYLFKYASEKSSLKNCTNLSDRMCYMDAEDTIIGTKLTLKIDEAIIRDALNYLSPNKANYMVVSKKAFDDLAEPVNEEKWFLSKYKVIDVPEKWYGSDCSEDYLKNVYFPEKNQFIAQNFEIFAQDSDRSTYPQKIYEDPSCRIWFKKDDQFQVPKAYVFVHLRSSFTCLDPRLSCAMDLFTESFQHNMTEEIYPADLAGLNFEISQMNGISMVFNGFTDKLPEFIDMVVDRLMNHQVDDETFEIVKKDVANSYEDCLKDRSTMAGSLLFSIISSLKPSYIYKKGYLQSLTKEAVMAIGQQFFAHLFMECLILGSLTQAKAIKIVESIAQKINHKPFVYFPHIIDQIFRIPLGDFTCRVLTLQPEERKSVIINYYQLQNYDLKASCISQLLGLAMSEPLFDQLRTQEGLGYEVYEDIKSTSGVITLSIVANSDANEFTGSYLNARIENFLKTFSKIIETMPESDFEEIRESLIKTKKSPHINLSKESKYYWREVIIERYLFDKREREIKVLEELKFNEYKDWVLKHLKETSNRRKLSIQVIGNGRKSFNECLLADDNTYKITPHSGQTVPGVLSGFTASSISAGKRLPEDPFPPRDTSDNALYAPVVLQYLVPCESVEGEQFIVNINEFRKNLSIYPHHSVYYSKL